MVVVAVAVVVAVVVVAQAIVVVVVVVAQAIVVVVVVVVVVLQHHPPSQPGFVLHRRLHPPTGYCSELRESCMFAIGLIRVATSSLWLRLLRNLSQLRQ